MTAGDPGDPARPVRGLPDALELVEEFRDRLAGRPVAVFSDYDGTLAPIVDDPDEADLPPATREALRRLSRTCPVAVLSGRDADDVRRRVGLDGLHYAGSHGFELRGPGGLREERASDHLESLDAAERELRAAARERRGVAVERKRFAVSLHHRRAPAEAAPEVERVARRVADGHPDLVLSRGKQVLELRPAVDWDKGHALVRLLEAMGLEREEACPVYLGDDVTDEDAFEVVRGRGIAVVVRGEDDDRPTRAEYALSGPAAVRRFLHGLADLVEARQEESRG